MSSVRNISHKRKEFNKRKDIRNRKWLSTRLSLLKFRLKTISRNMKTAIQLGWNGDDVVDTYNKLIRQNAGLHMENMRVHDALEREVETNLELSKEISQLCPDGNNDWFPGVEL